MRVVVFPADSAACGHYRIVWPSNILQAQGVNIYIVPPKGDTGFLIKTEEQPDGSQKLIQLTAPDCDVVVLQRPSHELQPQLIRALRSAGIAVVVDMDDDMSTVHPGNVAFRNYHTKSRTPFSWRTAFEACKEATLVTTSTVALQKTYAKHGRGMVLDNFIPEVVLNPDFVQPAVDGFGWAGTLKSHPDDLHSARGVQDLVDEGFPLRIVGDGKGVKEALKLNQEVEATGLVNLDVWCKTIASTYSVGMVPLSPTAFNTAKSRLKGIEHMAVGVPWVASPRAEYRRLNRESGCGFLADTPKEWVGHLRRLLTDEVLCKEQAEMGREFMKDQTYQAQAWRWQEAWTRALEIQRG
jgi:glycosyltransferase involved in cell wall biosynthesis